MNPAVSGRINLYRIVLAFFVIGIHTNYATSQSNGLAFYTSVALDVLYRTAVPGFFVLTGFLILDTADVTWEYSKKRLRKILLPWIVWSAIFLIYRVVALENRISIFSAIRCFLVGDTYYHLWFMYKLVGLYFVAPILGIFVRSAGLTKVAMVTLIAYLINIFCVDICRILEFFYPFSFQPAIYMTGIDNFVILAMAGWCSRQIITNPLLKWSTIGTFSLCYVVLVICTMKISLEQSRLIETAYYPSLEPVSKPS